LEIEAADMLGAVIMVGRIITGEIEKPENAPPLSPVDKRILKEA
jgi:hypothetical protein